MKWLLAISEKALAQVIKALPYARIWLWKDEVNQMSRALGGGRY
jgi:hypothetical protein